MNSTMLRIDAPSLPDPQENPHADHRHPVNFAYTRQELEALFRYANERDVDRGGHYDARSAAIDIWSHHWLNPATHAESETIATFYSHWEPPSLWQIETDEGFSLDDLMAEFGRLELQALGRVPHGDVSDASWGAG